MSKSVLKETIECINEIEHTTAKHQNIDVFAVIGNEACFRVHTNMDDAELAHMLFRVFRDDSHILQLATNAMTRLREGVYE